MRKVIIVGLTIALGVAGSATAGIDRVDISPAALFSLDNGRTGAAMGGALTGDIFFAKQFAVRTTVGFTKNRYFPENSDYSEADYGLWLSLAPYVETSIGKTLRPYAAIQGTFTSGGSSGYYRANRIVSPTAPAARLSTAATRDNAYSFGATLGSKVRLVGSVSMFAEVTHIFFTSFLNKNGSFVDGLPDVSLNYDFDENPTYISVGLSYSFDFGKKK